LRWPELLEAKELAFVTDLTFHFIRGGTIEECEQGYSLILCFELTRHLEGHHAAKG
jgi:hypothetical protein